MSKIQINSLEELEKFLVNFRSIDGDIYDDNLIFHLFLDLLDNMRKHQALIENIGGSCTDEQRKYLAEVARYANLITDAEIDAEDD